MTRLATSSRDWKSTSYASICSEAANANAQNSHRIHGLEDVMIKYQRTMQALGLAMVTSVIILAMATTSGSAQNVPTHIVEQYKAYIGDVGNIGSRYATAQTFYLAIISALIAIFSFKDTKRSLQDYFSPMFIVVYLFIAIICYLWWETLQYYRALFGAKFAVLKEMEVKQQLFPVFDHDYIELCKRRPANWFSQCPGLIDTESLVAVVIGCAALLFAAAAIISQIFRRKRR